MNKFSFIYILDINVILTTLYQLCKKGELIKVQNILLIYFHISYYYCKGNKCYGVDSISGSCDELTNSTDTEKANKNENIVADGYDEKYFEKIIGKDIDEYYPNCSKDSYCFSEKCIKGYYIFERNNPVKYCYLEFIKKNVRCGVPLNAYYKKKKDCFMGYCHFDKHLCVDYISTTEQNYRTYVISNLNFPLILGGIYISIPTYIFIILLIKL
ncbi:hypothetical protein H8356DRAFT_922437 [Neocallimastix lanati (nom. inval.)]|uniref:Uncharacterized protein n=1 Tax=Neocallimastix californiae TaxID=1754190 RepID=A0A1Y2DKV0_9FUNG|nr:hypothetical protein H8356DRAFT_922437 [Neocallimastix sp. JGI-2020a]ORY01372.1 hypothetical protein LY90DRAFT_519731 [Neocallimastix californiae]ORY59873.1 hypothetical protein LY90DRAFT_505990 [Neocallimastix californiae]|eukprot:ORY01372.1 hypothetical protein LY90DRAFT_519731 [Neocallimastix californiae]